MFPIKFQQEYSLLTIMRQRYIRCKMPLGLIAMDWFVFCPNFTLILKISEKTLTSDKHMN